MTDKMDCEHLERFCFPSLKVNFSQGATGNHNNHEAPEAFSKVPPRSTWPLIQNAKIWCYNTLHQCVQASTQANLVVQMCNLVQNIPQETLFPNCPTYKRSLPKSCTRRRWAWSTNKIRCCQEDMNGKIIFIIFMILLFSDTVIAIY